VRWFMPFQAEEEKSISFDSQGYWHGAYSIEDT
jgi:hypothetical protein